MLEIPDRIDLERHRDLRSYGFFRPARYALLGLLCAFLVLGLLNLFGQDTTTRRVVSPAAELELKAPKHLRGGLLYMTQITITAHEKLKHAEVLLARGWAEDQTINTIEPSPMAETSRNGDIVLTLGEIPKGEKYVLYLDFQVNPTNVGRHAADVVLYDGDRRLLTVDHTLTVFP